MKTIFSVLMAAAACSALADITLSNQSLVNNGDGTVTVSYTLSGGPAIVTLDILDGGTPIGAEHMWAISGDANVKVENGEHAIVWHPSVAYANRTTSSLSARLKAWDPADPPDYLVIDLAENSPCRRRYYATVEDLPGGLLSNRAYRTTHLPMRRIHAKGVTWKMGTVSSASLYSANEAEHDVTLGHDYYIGVFAVTRAQYAAVSGSFNPLTGWIGVEAICSYRPIVRVPYVDARGGAGFLYPDPPKGTSVVGRFRDRIGDTTMDLPSEAEWEFAARGGHYGELWGDGTTVGDNNWDANLNALGRNVKNNGPSYVKDGTASSYGFCGSYKPNDYGLYDMNGNVWEWCLDWYEGDITWNSTGVPNASGAKTLDHDDPTKASAADGTERVARGGHYNASTQSCRNCYRKSLAPGSYMNDYGVRLVCRDGLK